jgi:predicted metalloprotease
MKWRGRERSGNIEDRRGTGGLNRGTGGLNPFGRSSGTSFRVPGGRTGGGGIGGIIVIVVILGIIWVATGQNPLDMLTGNSSSVSPSTATNSQGLPQVGEDELADFVGVVLKETETTWTNKFASAGQTYQPAGLVLFDQATESGCGTAQSASGPFYCPNDQKVYIDLAFYNQLRQQFGAPGDFAQAYVLAHEVGHHVQNLEGTLSEFNQQRGQLSQGDANAYSVRIELQADCYAGVWANEVGRQNLLEAGDVEEAITAANAIGDDTLTRGTVQPRNFTHGTSEQRMKWLKIGMDSGDPAKCDTFSGGI